MALQRDLQFFCGSITVGDEVLPEVLPDALGGEAYVHLLTLGAEDAVNEC